MTFLEICGWILLFLFEVSFVFWVYSVFLGAKIYRKFAKNDAEFISMVIGYVIASLRYYIPVSLDGYSLMTNKKLREETLKIIEDRLRKNIEL